MKSKILNPFVMIVLGIFFGILARIADIFTKQIDNACSQMAIWILFGVLIVIYSTDKKKAVVNVFLFYLGMLLTYFVVMFLYQSLYGKITFIGWTFFVILSPLFAYLTYLTKEEGLRGKIISCGIILLTLLSSILLYDGLKIYDFMILAILIYNLFIKDKNG